MIGNSINVGVINEEIITREEIKRMIEGIEIAGTTETNLITTITTKTTTITATKKMIIDFPITKKTIIIITDSKTTIKAVIINTITIITARIMITKAEDTIITRVKEGTKVATE